MPRKGKNAGSTNLSNDIKSLATKLDKVAVSGTSKSARKRRNRRLRMNNPMTINPIPPYVGAVTKGPPSEMLVPGYADTGLRRLRITPRKPGVTDSGVAFLKCAFAPPDFTATSIAGVPDDFRGLSLVRKHRFVGSQSILAVNDYYFILAPVPGISYFVGTTLSGVAPTATTVWTGVNYADYVSTFGATNITTADQVDKFRFVSNHFELIPTINQMTWSGNIQAWKIPLSVRVRGSAGASTDLWTIDGLSGVNSTLANQYSAPFIKGVYTACYSSNPEFLFNPMLEGISTIPFVMASGVDFGQISGPNAIPGFDNGFESIVIKVSGVSTNETCLIKTWACVEYQCKPDSVLYPFQSLSPCDKIAMELYREIILGLPVGVPFEENESFWNRVLQIIHQLSGVGSALPGPYGMASRGVNLLSGAALSLL
jgi:hypothetical protein